MSDEKSSGDFEPPPFLRRGTGQRSVRGTDRG